MAAPVPTIRGTPAGIKMKDGYQALITFAVNPTVCFWEKALKPPGIDGGEPIDQTTMFNLVWRTMASRVLRTLTPFSIKAAYDPALYTYGLSLCNTETTITFRFHNNATIAFYGYARNFDFDELKEGAQPEVTINIVPTNADPVTLLEAGPTFTPAAGSP